MGCESICGVKDPIVNCESSDPHSNPAGILWLDTKLFIPETVQIVLLMYSPN